MAEPNETLERLCSAVCWAEESSVARKVNFDATTLHAIVDSATARCAFTPGQERAINHIYERWHIKGWEASRARKREAAAEAPASKRPRI